MFLYLVGQRDTFRDELQNRIPGLTPHDLDWLAWSLTYEGDAPLDVFPGTKIIWLEDGRPITSLEFSDYTMERLITYEHYLDKQYQMRNIHGVLVAMSLAAAQAGKNTQHTNPERYLQWADKINAEITPWMTWAIAVVGAIHTRLLPLTLRTILEEQA